MHFHRGLGDADIVGNLLVQATSDDMEHDLTFAGAERIETLLEHSHCLIVLSTSMIASEAGLDGIKQFLITEWLCKELYRTALHRLHSHRYVGLHSTADDLQLPDSTDRFALKL